MAETFYAQSDSAARTMTVERLIAILKHFDPALPVVFRSPKYGCYGPHTEYTIDKASSVDLERQEIHHPATSYEDDETGETIHHDAWVEVRHPWYGIVIE